MANRAHGVLSKFFKWVCARDDELTSPVIGVERPAPERARERMLDDDEIVRLWKALDAIGGPTAAALQVLVLTGQRKHEIALLEWDEIGLGVMDAGINVLDLPAARMKGRQAHMLPMSTQAAEIIDAQPRVNDLVFAYKRPHFERLKREIDARMGDVSKWVIHDVRRSVASGMARIGIALPVIEKVLAHRKGSFAGVAGTYQRHTFLPEMASALQRWGDHVEGLVSGRKLTKVVRLHKPQ
jgi:integrase